MLHEGTVAFEGSPDQMRASNEPVVASFLRGEASEAEMAAIRSINQPWNGKSPERI